MDKRNLIAMAMVAIIATVSGCTSVSRGIGKLTSNKYAEPRSGTIWTVAPPQLEPPSPANKTVYISYRNISDAQSVQLLDELKNAATTQGWLVIDDPQQAKYRLRASLRYYGEVEPNTGGRNIANGLGVIAGAAVGIGTGSLISSRSSRYGAAYAGGLAAGGLVAAGISNASKPREWALILDFVLEEYNENPVEFELMRSSGTESGDSTGSSNTRMATGGSSQANNSSSASMRQQSNYFPHGVRLSAWANQMNMEEHEALPLVQEKVRTVITQILPM
jgi:hypothetical protein